MFRKYFNTEYISFEKFSYNIAKMLNASDNDFLVRIIHENAAELQELLDKEPFILDYVGHDRFFMILNEVELNLTKLIYPASFGKHPRICELKE